MQKKEAAKAGNDGGSLDYFTSTKKRNTLAYLG
jgi:hypothetical protein